MALPEKAARLASLKASEQVYKTKGKLRINFRRNQHLTYRMGVANAGNVFA